jgi:hypothetical protein
MHSTGGSQGLIHDHHFSGLFALQNEVLGLVNSD